MTEKKPVDNADRVLPQKNLPPGTTLGGLYFASDSTVLSMHSGDVAAHGVYMSLDNLDKSTRASISENTWILVAYIPKSKFKHTMMSQPKGFVDAR